MFIWFLAGDSPSLPAPAPGWGWIFRETRPWQWIAVTTVILLVTCVSKRHVAIDIKSPSHHQAQKPYAGELCRTLPATLCRRRASPGAVGCDYGDWRALTLTSGRRTSDLLSSMARRNAGDVADPEVASGESASGPAVPQSWRARSHRWGASMYWAFRPEAVRARAKSWTRNKRKQQRKKHIERAGHDRQPF